MSSNIIVTTHEHLGNETAITERKTPDGYVPGDIAGYIVDECTVLCPSCIDWGDINGIEDYDYIGCMEEWDYPGATCENCLEYLDTNLLVYEGHNPEIFEELKD